VIACAEAKMDTANKNKLVIAASSQDRLGVVRLCFMAWLLFYHYSITYDVSFLFELSEQDLSLDVRVRPSATPSDAATAASGVDNVTAVEGSADADQSAGRDRLCISGSLARTLSHQS
jgi:hypothetical protein